MAPLQLFGTVETAEGTASAMLCRDADLPNEAMIHWWGRTADDHTAVLAEGFMSGKQIHLTPLLWYRTAENGSLFAPTLLNDEELKWMRGTSATLQVEGEGLGGKWSGPNGEMGKLWFGPPPKTPGPNPTQCNSWDDFKKWASLVRTEHDAVVFRGHGSSKFKLETTLHRSGRTRIERYCNGVLTDFKTHAEAVLGMKFNFLDGDDYATLMGLAQHHGLPTPLLDWTGSPYIAAFFAFADAIEAGASRADATHVRLYALSREFVTATSPASVTLARVEPYVASLAIAPRLNPRLYAQQGRFLVTNVGNLENYIRFLEKQTNRQALFTADIPTSVASEALEDLAFMGLTAATMFPGLDGVSRMLRHSMAFSRPRVPAAGKAAVAESTSESTRDSSPVEQLTATERGVPRGDDLAPHASSPQE